MASKAVDLIEVDRTVVSTNWRKNTEEKGKEGCIESMLKLKGIRRGILLPSKESILNSTMYYKPKISERKDLKYISTKNENSNNGTYVKCLFTSKHCVKESKYHDVYHRHTIFSCQSERHRLMLPKRAYHALTNAHCCVFMLKTRKLPKDSSYIFKMCETYFQY